MQINASNTFLEMPLTMQCLGAFDNAGWFLPLQSPCRRDGSTCCSQTTVAIVAGGKSVSPVGIDEEISQLILDVRSKTKKLSKKVYIISGQN